MLSLVQLALLCSILLTAVDKIMAKCSQPCPRVIAVRNQPVLDVNHRCSSNHTPKRSKQGTLDVLHGYIPQPLRKHRTAFSPRVPHATLSFRLWECVGPDRSQSPPRPWPSHRSASPRRQVDPPVATTSKRPGNTWQVAEFSQPGGPVLR